MPGEDTDQVNEWMKFVLAAQSGLYIMTELCAEYGISRKAGYKILGRFKAEGLGVRLSPSPGHRGVVTPGVSAVSGCQSDSLP